jgi:dephospho-CoA kinase
LRLRVGLTGGIGAGKSTVADVLRDLGAVVIDADALARDALAHKGEGVARVLALFPEATSADGTVDRAALAARVFADPDARAALNAIVHPIVRERAARLEREAPAAAIVVHEVPLLFETAFDRTCDATVLVAAPVEQRIARVAARSGLERDEILRRMAAQIDPAEARRRATYTIENDGTLERLRARCADIWRVLEGLPPRAA